MKILDLSGYERHGITDTTKKVKIWDSASYSTGSVTAARYDRLGLTSSSDSAADLPILYSSGLYPKCLTNVETPSDSFPSQLGHVPGHRDLYLNIKRNHLN